MPQAIVMIVAMLLCIVLAMAIAHELYCYFNVYNEEYTFKRYKKHMKIAFALDILSTLLFILWISLKYWFSYT